MLSCKTVLHVMLLFITFVTSILVNKIVYGENDLDADLAGVTSIQNRKANVGRSNKPIVKCFTHVDSFYKSCVTWLTT